MSRTIEADFGESLQMRVAQLRHNSGTAASSRWNDGNWWHMMQGQNPVEVPSVAGFPQSAPFSPAEPLKASKLIDGRGYPRPQLVREKWWSLNGEWEFAFDDDGTVNCATDVPWDRKIVVPFAPECRASGIADSGFHKVVWYKRTFNTPPMQRGERLILHFGAIDYSATVWINGLLATTHQGGYSPFSIDVTELLSCAPGESQKAEQTIVVRVEDDPHDLAKPRGKQDWQLEPHAIWYPRTTGIWQSVWMETVPEVWINKVRWTPNVQRWEITLECQVRGPHKDDIALEVELSVGGRRLAKDRYTFTGNDVTRRIALTDPGIDDYRNEMLWNPRHPTLIDAELRLVKESGEVIETVQSYTALRSVAAHGDKFLLNGRPLRLRMVLDQGVWPETGLTAPDDAALKRDVELVKAMGFNGVRKHQKVEDPRFLYWCDVLGVMVWEEMPSAYRFTKLSVERLIRDWTEILDRDLSHPCVVTWVPFNESWGVPDLPNVPEHRHYVKTLYHLTKTLDPTRPVIGNDGWESVATDIISVHDYDENHERLFRRYATEEEVPNLFKISLPAGRVIALSDTPEQQSQPVMLTEFGGFSISKEPGQWGYFHPHDEKEFAERFRLLLSAIRSLSIFAGFCYTQFCDTYQETNGLLYADRTPKIPLEEIAAATKGPLETSTVYYEDGPPH